MYSKKVAITVDNLSKRYQLYDQPQDRFKAIVMPKLNRWLSRRDRTYSRQVDALRPVTFKVHHGTTLGVIGTNGSGKSTLLQLICGTLQPTTGNVLKNGRIAALLELGSGFNTEFTGRENIYLNAAILGLSDQQITQRLDRIIAFADIGDFIDQPVKTYSSGMYVRLAFAIIAHVDADILVIDEALAVGDAIFTQKCMRYIRGFQQHGTLIFVSHDTASVQSLCDQCLWLNQGEMVAIGDAKAITEKYLKFSLQQTYGDVATLEENQKNDTNSSQPVVDYQAKTQVIKQLEEADGWQTGKAAVSVVEVANLNDAASQEFKGGERVKLTIQAQAFEELERPILGFVVKDRLGQVLFGENTLVYTDLTAMSAKKDQRLKAQFVFRLPMLPNGEYAVSASIADGDLDSNVQHHYLHDALILSVTSSKVRWGLVGIPFEKVIMQVSE